MKKFLILASAVCFSLSIFAKDMQELVVTTTPPMYCQNCENKIKKGNLRFEKGVKKIETNLKDQRVIIEYDADKTNPENIENAFEKIGYKVTVISPENASSNQPVAKSSCNNCGNNCQSKGE